MIRTRFAPSPTGYLHIGGARTALFSWAYARHYGGQFVLRIEDTDLERSTEASVEAILDGMQWLGLNWDEGPIRQTSRLDRYRDAVEILLRDGKAYPCYSTREELDLLRDDQRRRGEKPRYDGRWRPENARALGLKPPGNVKPVIRFRNPSDGEVSFDDEVKGRISFSNDELDDLVIMRSDGMPTYNFGVVVDDLDMQISHVIRGDDHVNNTPRQINIIKALGGTLPIFAHVPMILGADGERLSKRHGAVSVTQYRDDGFLPEGLINYLARLGWSHGDAELFSVDQLVEWFDLRHISHSPAKFDPDKLRWLNHQYLKSANSSDLAELVSGRLASMGVATINGPSLADVVSLLKERSETIEILTDEAMMFYRNTPISEELLAEHLNNDVRSILSMFHAELSALGAWTETEIASATKATLARSGEKMAKLAIPVRVCVFGTAKTPDFAKVLTLAGRGRVLERLSSFK
jgi:glutamyl-tRNA synthetase